MPLVITVGTLVHIQTSRQNTNTYKINKPTPSKNKQNHFSKTEKKNPENWVLCETPVIPALKRSVYPTHQGILCQAKEKGTKINHSPIL